MKTGMQRMLDDIKTEVRYTRSMIGKEALDERVMQAMTKVVREEFVPDTWRAFAYNNGPLSIGHGQTISQPYIVALMTDLLQLEPAHHVLEIGTGSGYQTAILSLLAEQVYTVEVISPLSESARQRLQRLGYHNIAFHVGDGHLGWADHAPYDAIIVTASATHIPPALVDQLKPGGRLVIPVGLAYMPQELMVVTKDARGETSVDSILGVAFVPLVQKKHKHKNARP